MNLCGAAPGAEETLMPQPLEVEQLVEAARAGDAAAWDALVDRYLPLVTAVIRRLRLSGARVHPPPPPPAGRPRRRHPAGGASPGRAPRRAPRAASPARLAGH